MKHELRKRGIMPRCRQRLRAVDAVEINGLVRIVILDSLAAERP